LGRNSPVRRRATTDPIGFAALAFPEAFWGNTLDPQAIGNMQSSDGRETEFGCGLGSNVFSL